MAQRGVNKVILVGNLGGDPEMRYMANGDAVANFNIATSDTWKDKQTGENKEKTEWHRIVIYRKLGEIAGQYLRKGSKVYIEGRLQYRKYQDKDGVERNITEIVADQMQMLDSKGGGSEGYSAPQQRQQPQARAAAPAMAGSNDIPDFDDDIPF